MRFVDARNATMLRTSRRTDMTTDEPLREPSSAAPNPDVDPEAVVPQITEALRGLKFGQVTITVHDGLVVQIERLERTRLKRRGE
jgi:hypothetical protein